MPDETIKTGGEEPDYFHEFDVKEELLQDSVENPDTAVMVRVQMMREEVEKDYKDEMRDALDAIDALKYHAQEERVPVDQQELHRLEEKLKQLPVTRDAKLAEAQAIIDTYISTLPADIQVKTRAEIESMLDGMTEAL